MWMLYLSLLSFPCMELYANNLSHVYQTAQSYDAQLMSQESSYLAVTENRALAESAKKPQLTMTTAINGSYTHIAQEAVSPLTLDDEFNLNAAYTVRLSKSLYNPKIDQQIHQAEAGIQQAHAGLEAQRQSLIMRVAQRYFNYLSAEQRLEFIRDELASVKKRMDQTEAFYNVGRAPITGMREAQARYYQVTAKQVNAMRDLDVSREALSVITGRHYTNLKSPNPAIPLVMPMPQTLEEWIQLALQHNKTLRSSYNAIKVAQADLAMARQGNAPQVDMVASHSSSVTEGEALMDTRLTQFSFGLEAAVPFYTGGATAASIRQSQHKLTSAQQAYQYQKRLTEERVRSAYLTLQSSISFAQASQQSLLASQTALNATVAGFEVGARTAVDVLDAQSDLSDAQSTESKARNDFLLNQLNLRAVAGTLSAADLHDIDRVLQ